MKNPFETHGIEHLSPSSINLYAAAPAVFLLEKVLKKRGGGVGPAAHRGTAVEHGIVHGLSTGADLRECQDKARKEFSTLTALQSGDKVDKETKAVPDMVAVGLAELRSYGPPSSTQGKVVHHVDRLAVPILGYYDLEWEKKGILIDIKTTHALPSRISTAHARQVALYHAGRGGNLDCRLTYVTPKKSATYSLENPEEHLKSLINMAYAIQRLLSISADPMELVGLFAPDTESFYVTGDPVTRQHVFDVWGV